MDFPFIPVKPEQLLKTMRVMKITALILLIACLHVSARSHSQNVTLTAEHMPLKEVLQAIKNQTGYAIFYKKGALDQTRPVTLQVSNLPLAFAVSANLPGKTHTVPGSTSTTTAA